jgi:hypothetical protein
MKRFASFAKEPSVLSLGRVVEPPNQRTTMPEPKEKTLYAIFNVLDGTLLPLLTDKGKVFPQVHYTQKEADETCAAVNELFKGNLILHDLLAKQDLGDKAWIVQPYKSG